MDLAERGESCRSTQNEGTASLVNTPSRSATLPVGLEEDITAATGRTGAARRRQFSRDWQFFPACERQFSLVLDYLSAKSWAKYCEIEQLERKNRGQGLHDYKEHIMMSDDEYGKKKEELMNEQIAIVEKYAQIFHSAIGIMNQHPPNVQHVNEYRLWASENASLDTSDYISDGDNYRSLGPRPSMVDSVLHSLFKTVESIRYSRRQKATNAGSGVVTVSWSSTTFRVLAHIFLVIFAFVFLLLPLALINFLNLGKGRAAVVILAFCLCFCIIFFVLGSLNTNHKFLLLFTYTSVMVTLLGNLTND
ncbi:hypothetical protein B0T25DRAFT_556259 [Lasiosphaeria hispida]|uniref:DUF6594 domain-containing protein n=1 Tax=Lasiosphaeria hispida TaxID=260671 RepID=A0AAJ0M9S5_9PEZI|nr:hypothetical protein B0T25DRAFT_556259 [Lasiosphaeria hispida]